VIMRPELFYQPRKVKTSKMHLNFAGKSFIVGHIKREIVPRTFSVILASENFRNASELHSKQLRFWTHKS